MKLKTIALTAMLSAAIAGCSSSDPIRNMEYKALTNKQKTNTDSSTAEDKYQYNKARYLNRFLLDSKQKGKLFEELSVADNWPQRTAQNNANIEATAAAVIGLSNMGALNMAFSAVDALFGRDIEYVSYVTVPEELNGVSYNTPEMAVENVRREWRDNIVKSLRSQGYEVTSYNISNNKETEVFVANYTKPTQSDQVVSHPNRLVVRATVNKAIEVKTVAPLDEALLGFVPKYKVIAVVEMFSDIIKDEQGNDTVLSNGEGDTKYLIPRAQNRVTNKIVNRQLYRDLSKAMPWQYVSKKWSEDYIVVDGRVYDWGINTAANLIPYVHIN